MRTQGCVESESDCSNGSHKSLGKRDSQVSDSTRGLQGLLHSTRGNVSYENLFLGTLPKRLILWCIDNDAYNGEYSIKTHSMPRTMPLTSWPSTSTDVKCRPNHSSQTSRPASTFEATSTFFPPPVNKHRTKLLRDDFGKGYTFFGFDLTPDGCDGGRFHLTRKGNLCIEIHFATALEQTMNVVVYGEFEAVPEIDKGRNIIY